MNKRQKHLTGCLLLIALGWCVQPALSADGVTTSNRKPANKKAVKHASVYKPASRHSSRRRSNFRYRLARLQPSSDRITEIQQALIREGYLKQEATGKWDGATRSAMSQYQQANGFASTGLPDSKSLMKLGLGPHALPDDANPSIAGQASINPPAKADPPAQPAVSNPPNSPNNRP